MQNMVQTIYSNYLFTMRQACLSRWQSDVEKNSISLTIQNYKLEWIKVKFNYMLSIYELRLFIPKNELADFSLKCGKLLLKDYSYFLPLMPCFIKKPYFLHLP